jgi:hypothetical protein
MAKLMVTGEELVLPSMMAWRNDPAPLSAVLTTVIIVVASALERSDPE